MLSERCDLLLTDVDLQVVHGLEVIEPLRQVDQGAACLMMAASTAVETAVAAMVTDHPCHKALSLEVALDQICRGAGTQLDLDLAQAFLAHDWHESLALSA